MSVVAAAAAAVALFLGCGAGRPSREEEAARLQAKLSTVQAVACLSPATQRACEPGLAAAFESAPGRGEASARKGSIWCEGGRPQARVAAASGEVTGEIGQVVWEAIWRVLEATDFCAAAHGGAVAVTRNGQTQACKDPRFDMHELFDMAFGQAKQGPPAVVRTPSDGICEIDPQACPSPPGVCPLFLGDPWNGVRAERDGAAGNEAEPGDGPDSGNEAEPGDGPDSGNTPGPGNAPDPVAGKAGEASAAAASGRRPAPGEVTKAINMVLGRARKCVKVGAGTAIARIVFQSDGSVQRVEVKNSGEATTACLAQVLRTVRVARFADPSFEVSFTIRPQD